AYRRSHALACLSPPRSVADAHALGRDLHVGGRHGRPTQKHERSADPHGNQFPVRCWDATRLSAATDALVAGVTQTWSDGTTSRQTKPYLHVSGPAAPPLPRRLAALALSLLACVRVSGVTHT